MNHKTNARESTHTLRGHAKGTRKSCYVNIYGIVLHTLIGFEASDKARGVLKKEVAKTITVYRAIEDAYSRNGLPKAQ